MTAAPVTCRSTRTSGSSTTCGTISATPPTWRPSTPEKLKELQALFDREARKYNVYPMADDHLSC